MKAASRSSMVPMTIVTPASHRNNAEARTEAGFGHQKIGRGWQGDVRMKVSALGVPSLSDVPCIGTVLDGLKCGGASALRLRGPAPDQAVPRLCRVRIWSALAWRVATHALGARPPEEEDRDMSSRSMLRAGGLPHGVRLPGVRAVHRAAVVTVVVALCASGASAAGALA